MRLAVILPSLVNQGPVLVARDIVHHLAQHLEAVHVYHFDEAREIEFRVPTFRISLWQAIPFEEYDVIHSHMLRPDFYLWMNRRRIRGACLTTLHNYVEADLRYRYGRVTSLLFTRIWRTLVSRHDTVVALSSDMERYYRSLYGRGKITYIYNGRDERSRTGELPPEERAAIEKRCSGKTVIGAVALLTRRKGIHQLIKLVAADSRYLLMVVGSGQEEGALRGLARRLGVAERCLFLGYRPDPAPFFRYFDVYAIPSVSEGFPLALIEAASFSKAVVCSDIPVFREIFSEREVSYFTLEDIDSLGRAVERAARERERYAERIYRKYRECYTARTMAMNYLALYREAAGLPLCQGGHPGIQGIAPSPSPLP